LDTLIIFPGGRSSVKRGGHQAALGYAF
jgi:hypothetical protein